MPERLYPLSTFSAGITLVARLGFNFDSLAEMAGIPHGLLGDPQALISARQYHELCVLGKSLLHDPAFALNVVDFMQLEMFDLLGPLFSTSATVRSYLADTVAFIQLIDPCVDLALDEEGDEVRCLCRVLPDQGADDRFFHAEACFAGGDKFMRQVFGGHLPGPRHIEMQHDGSAWLAQYHRRFGAGVTVRFNAAENVIVLDRDLLDVPNPGHSPAVNTHMRKLLLARMAALPSVDTVGMQVARLLEQEAGRRVLDLADVALALGMSARTLQRRLGEEHTTFQQLRDGVRLRQAQVLLRRTDTDIPTIAATLGYSEPSAFQRAFKAWSGLSPTEFRRLDTARDPE